MSTERTIGLAGGGLFLAHVGAIATLGTAPPGPFISDLIQLGIGTLVVIASIQAGRRSEGLARSFWRLCASAYCVWFVAQSISVAMDVTRALSPVVGLANLLFSFWFVPLAMAIFLDPEQQSSSLDASVVLDFVQAVLVCIAAYVYFFYLPKSDSPGELAHSVWAPYFLGYGVVVTAFLLRAFSTTDRVSRRLFGSFGAMLAVSGVVDALYYYGPGSNLKTGAWFDLMWSTMLLLPMGIALTWRQPEVNEISYAELMPSKRTRTEIFCLFYPVLVLLMSFKIAQERLGLAAAFVLLSFLCSSARLLVTQGRLVDAKDALRREASRDALTGLWNRKAILDILGRELLRAERDRAPVGVIMADVDHFKSVNDSRGHAAGDVVLRIICSEIAAVVRPYDSVGRYGGEEFLAVAPGCGVAETLDLAERIRDRVEHCSIMAQGISISVTLSLGVAVASSAEELESLLRNADTALYKAKGAGRNRVEPSYAGTAAVAAPPAPENKFWL